MDDCTLAKLLNDLGGSALPDSVLSEVIELVRVHGEHKGRQEAYGQYRQAHDVAAGQREQELAHRCQVLLAQMERLIRVNRYLFSLIEDARDGKRANDNPMAVFSRCPRTGKREKLHLVRVR